MNFDDSAEHRSQATRFPPPSKYTNSPVGKGQPGAPDDMAWPSRTRHQSQRPRSGSLACAPPRRPVNKHRRWSPTIGRAGVVWVVSEPTVAGSRRGMFPHLI